MTTMPVLSSICIACFLVIAMLVFSCLMQVVFISDASEHDI